MHSFDHHIQKVKKYAMDTFNKIILNQKAEKLSCLIGH